MTKTKNGTVDILHDPQKEWKGCVNVHIKGVPESAARGWQETKWDQWLSCAMPEPGNRRRLMMEFGHAAIGSPDGIRLIRLNGTRGSGAAEFLHIVTEALGGYSYQIPAEIIIKGDTIPYEHRLDILYQVCDYCLLYITAPPHPTEIDYERLEYMLDPGRLLVRKKPVSGIEAGKYQVFLKNFSIAMVTQAKRRLPPTNDSRVTDFYFTGYNTKNLCHKRMVRGLLHRTNQKSVDAWLADGARQWMAENPEEDSEQLQKIGGEDTPNPEGITTQ